MTELVEKGFHLTESKQGRLLGRRLREIHHHADMRPHVLHIIGTEGFLHVDALHPLALIFGHPCPTLLALAGMEIGIEDGQIGTVLIEHLVGFHVGMINGDVLVLLEGDAVEAVGEAEHAVDNLRQFEVGTQHLGIDIVFLQLELMRVI